MEHYAKDERFVRRFQKEARSAAALNHPNVVQIYDQGRAEDGRYYIAMEHMTGGSLEALILRRGPLGPWEAAGSPAGCRGPASGPRTRHRPP